jgi:SHS2 domain-containing protein
MTKKGYEFLDHKSDVKVRCWGSTLEEAFSQAALSIFDTITDIKTIEKKISKTFQVSAEDKKSLLFEFLSEFLYFFDTQNLIFSDVKILKIDKRKGEYLLNAQAKGEEFNPTKHSIGIEVKAITYSYMKIQEKKKKTTIEVIFDI